MKKIKIGLDFDGVIVYNPFRIIRAPITFFKRYILKSKPKFWIPQSTFQKFIWILMHKTSIIPASGIELLKQMSNDSRYEFHLITGRYSFLVDDLYSWLKKNGLSKTFKSINPNVNNDQPNIFKEKTIDKLKLDFFVEDNLDIVDYLNRNSNTKIYWISNILDWRHTYKFKFPHLKQALEKLQ